LNIQLLEAGALLHDIAKPQSICTGEKHEKLGACMLRQWGYHSVAPIVEDHVSMDHARASGPVTESLLVNYSDKRVKHDEIVTLDERFEDLINRYARTEAHKASLAQKLNLYSMLEARIFSYINMSPDGVGILGLRLPLHFTPGGESQDYEQEEVICRTAVRGEVR
jgi:hypothetical protein